MTTPRQSNNITGNNVFQQRIQQVVVEQTLTAQEFRNQKLKQFKVLFKDKNLTDFSLQDLESIVTPQGVTLSHNVNFPSVEQGITNIAHSLGMGPRNAADVDYSAFLQSGFPDFLNTYLFNFKLYLIIIVIITIYGGGSLKNNKSSGALFLKRMKYFSLSMLMVIMLFKEAKGTLWNDHYITRIREHFWIDLYPQWTEMVLNMEQDEGVQMTPLGEFGDVHPQSAADNLPYITTSLIGVLTVLLGFKVKEKFVMSLIHLSKVSPLQYTNVSTMLINGSLIFSGLLKDIGLSNLSTYFDIDVCDSSTTTDFLKKTNGFLDKINAGDVYSSAYHTEVYTQLISQGEDLARRAEKGSYDSRVISEHVKKLRECSSKVEVLRNSLNGTRIETVGVMIKGRPGCFKTVLSDRISRLVGSYTIPTEWKSDYDKDPKEFHYALPKDKFFDGYSYMKWIVTSDDIFQARDAVGDTDSEALRVISMINTAEYVLPMANVNQKNCWFFRSPFLFATTNFSNWNNLSSVESAEAVRRRFNVELSVEVNPKYLNCKGKTDFNKLPMISLELEMQIESGLASVEQCTSIPNDFWKIQICERNGDNETLPVNISFEDVVVKIIESHHQRIKNYYVNRQTEKFYIDELKTKLDKKFLSNKLYSSMAYNTLLPQSGLPGDYSSNYEEIPTLDMGFQEFSDSLTISERNLLCLQYMEMLAHNNLFDVLSNGYPSLYTFMSSLSLVDQMEFINIFQDRDLFFSRIYDIFNHRVLRNEDRLTGIPLITVDTPETHLNNFRQTLLPYVDFVNKYKIPLMLGGAILTTGLFWVCGFFKATLGEPCIPQSVDLSRDRAKVGRPVSSLKDNLYRIGVRPQAPKLGPLSNVLPKIDVSLLGHNTNSNDVISQILNKYMFITYVISKKPDGTLDVARLGHAWNIRGQVFMMPLHFMYKLHDVHKRESYAGASVVFTTCTNSTKYTCAIEDILRSFKISDDSANNDACLFTIAAAHKTSVGILKHIAKVDDIKRLKRSSAFNSTIVGTYLSREEKTNSVRLSKNKVRFQDRTIVTSDWDHDEAHYALENVMRYDGDFSGGDCGSMLVVDGNNFENRCIFGMHVAGDTGEVSKATPYGISTVIVQEYLVLLMDEAFPESHIFDDEEGNTFIIPYPVEAQGNLKPVGKLTPEKSYGDITKTELVRSVLFGKLMEPFEKVVHFPARQRPFKNNEGIVIDPGEKALSNYRKEPPYIPEHIVSNAVASYESLIHQYVTVPKDERRTVPLKEALHSFGNVRSIASSTSPGIPMSHPSETNLKKLYYKSIEEKNLDNTLIYYERIAILVDNRLELYNKGIRPLTFYKDCLKDEKRPLDKISSGSTRLFSAGEFINLCLFRMYFGSFMSGYFEANLDVGSAIGVNPYSRDWDRMARDLLKFSNKKTDLKIGAGDYSKFDASECPQVLDAILGLINRWYGNENPDNHIRSKLWAEISNSRHIFRNEVYDWKTGLPSGNPLTAIVNTIYNHIAFRMAYQLAGLPISSFNRKVVLKALGDDNIFSVDDSIMSIFNEMTLVDLMDKIGMTYTTELKQEAVLPFRSIGSVEFLKRSFRFDPTFNRWVAPLRLEAIFIPLNWTKKGVEGDQITADSISSAISELSLHGIQIFDNYAPKLLDLKSQHLAGVTSNKDTSLDYRFVYDDVLKSEFMF